MLGVLMYVQILVHAHKCVDCLWMVHKKPIIVPACGKGNWAVGVREACNFIFNIYLPSLFNHVKA